MIKKLLFAILLSFTFSSVFSQTVVKYNPTTQTPLNKPIGMSGKPVDARSYYYDPFNFIYRPYNDTSEVRQCLLPNSVRGGNFPIYVKSGDSINIWWYRNGTNDNDLVPLQLGGGGSSTIDTTAIHNQLVALNNALEDKVDKVSGKQLSTNDYTTTEKNKLSGIQSGAEQNVNADWNASSGDAQILNKPSIPAQFNPIEGTGISLSGTYPNITFNGFSGVYDDLSGKPAIPTKVSDLTNDLNFATINDASTSSSSTYSSDKINSLISGAGGGTVLSVGLTAPTGFSVSGSPVTSSGNIALSFASGYSLPTTSKQNTWDAKIGPSDTSVFARKTELFSKDYGDLINKPSLFDGKFSSLMGIPTTIAGYGITDAFDGKYSSLTGAPTIPTVNDNTITVSVSGAGTGGGNFTLNQSSNKTISISVPQNLSAYTNDPGFLTGDSLAGNAVDAVDPLTLDVENNELKIKTATTSQIGVVKPDGSTITIDGDGTIHSVGGGDTGNAYTKTQTDSITADTKDYVSDNYTNKNEFNAITTDTTLLSSGTGEVRGNKNLRVNPNIILGSQPTDSIDYGSTKGFAQETLNGDGSTTAFHVTFDGVTGTPLAVIFTPASADAAKAQFYVDNIDSEGFDLVATGTTPPSGTGNIKIIYTIY